MRAVPALERAGIRKFFMNGPESFTPDNALILGEAPELDGLLRRRRLQLDRHPVGRRRRHGARRVDRERPSADGPLGRRHPPLTVPGQRAYLRDRAAEGLGLLYAMHWPYRQYGAARPARRSPVHERLAARGACFGETAGWERPTGSRPPGAAPPTTIPTGGRLVRHWAAEHRAVRERAGLFDLSSFGKFGSQGRDAERSCSGSAPTTSRSSPAAWSTPSG